MQPEEHDEMNAADRELEAALKSLSPTRPTDIDPIAAAFAAGRRAARTQVRLWQSAAAAVLVIAVGSWLAPFSRPWNDAPPVIVSVNSAPTVMATAPAQSLVAAPGRHSLVTLEQAVYEKGVEGLPATELPTVRNLRMSDLF